MLRGLERRLVDEHLLGRVVRRGRMVLDRGLEHGVDAGRLQDGLHLLRLGDVLGERYLDHPAHDNGSSPTSTTASIGAGASTPLAAPPFTSRGIPRSLNGSSMISKSLGTTVSAKTSRASRAASRPEYRLERCVRASSSTPASQATVAASAAVECDVSRARSRSSSRKVASCTSTSAAAAASVTEGDGAVSPAMTSFLPGRGGPRTCSGWMMRPPTVTGSPACSTPRSG